MKKDQDKRTIDIAITLDYDGGEFETPTVGTSLRGDAAREIQKVARRYGVKIEKDSELAKELKNVKPNEKIPEESYEKVAKILLKK